jgi:sugar phosphate permease
MKNSDHLKNATMICAVAWNMIDVVGTAVVGYNRDKQEKGARVVDAINAVQLFACTVPAMCYLADSHLVSEALATQLAGTSFTLAMLLCLASDYLSSEKFEKKDALGMGCATLGMGLIAAGSFIANNADAINVLGLFVALTAGLTRLAKYCPPTNT